MLDARIVTKDGHTISVKRVERSTSVVVSTVNKVGHVSSVELTEDELEELKTVLQREWLSV